MKNAYVHVPFCDDICSYCDFTRCRYHETLVTRWLPVIEKEIHSKLYAKQLSTLYIGGGTPSSLQPKQLQMLLEALSSYTKKVNEYTIEANMESLSDEKLDIMKRYGVNRISLGVQTFQDDLLRCINRHHDRAMTMDTLKRIHQHDIHNISLDFIYGLPNQSMEQWQEDLSFVCRYCDITHISLYALTIEEHSAFGRQGVKPMDGELECDMFEYAIDYLEKQGFEHYEISNFARAGMQSQHNQAYWRYNDFAGIGCGASGKENHRRYDNTGNLQTYIEAGPSPEWICLNKEDEMFEMLMMGLRMREGMSLDTFKERFHVDFLEQYKEPMKRQCEKGLLRIEHNRVRTSYRGMLMLNDVLTDFL